MNISGSMHSKNSGVEHQTPIDILVGEGMYSGAAEVGLYSNRVLGGK
jgi:hypothetical protein